jgi:hypothetical protein
MTAAGICTLDGLVLPGRDAVDHGGANADAGR